MKKFIFAILIFAGCGATSGRISETRGRLIMKDYTCESSASSICVYIFCDRRTDKEYIGNARGGIIETGKLCER